jgi:DnaJ homolog subfamily B member 4
MHIQSQKITALFLLLHSNPNLLLKPMPPMEYYKVLNVDQNATEQELRIAFRKFALAYHPDRNPGNKKAERIFMFGSNAHDVLMDPEKRRIYDEYGEEGLKNGWTPPPHPSRQNYCYHGSTPASSSRQSKSTNPSSSSSSSSSSRQSYGKYTPARTSSLHHSYGNVFSFRRSYANNPSFYKPNSQHEYRRTSTGGEPVKKKDAPVYRKLHCSLEQLYTGAVRKMKITRNVIIKG